MRKSNDYDFGRKVYAALSSVLTPDSSMLDIGAGPGSFTIPFAQHIKSVTAIEPSKGMVAVLKENAKELNVENINIIEELVQDLPQDGSPDFRFDLVTISLVLWMFPDVWPRLLQMEQYSKGYCAIVAGIPDWKNPREASKSDVQEFQILYNMLLSQGRSPNVSIIDYRCERTVEDEIECRKIIYEQYYGDLTPAAEEQIKKEIIEKVILVAVADQDTTEAEESLDELEELVKTAGAEVAARVIQVRETPHPGTYIGKGKIDEVNALLYGTDATGIVCDDELSPAQISNLEEALDTKVMDRTLIILDIFAKRAFTREGKIQVELAQLKYRASKLTGQGRALSRLGGGIGTRGPGEKKLEMDRRLIRTRISRLKAELRDVVKHREVQRKQRQKNHLPVVCIVGYTNAGKSTLLNHFTNAGVYEEDQLFATLDPTTKSLDLSGGQTILMTDTVGFIRKLPHHLVEAFKSTLEEAKYSDLILHVVDASNPQKEKQMEAVYDTLKQLGANESPIITAFNKIDLLNGDEILKDSNAEAVVRISGKNGEGTDQLLEQIEKILQKQKLYLEKLYGYQEAGKIQLIRSHGQLLKEEYRDDGIYVEAYIPKEILGSI